MGKRNTLSGLALVVFLGIAANPTVVQAQHGYGDYGGHGYGGGGGGMGMMGVMGIMGAMGAMGGSPPVTQAPVTQAPVVVPRQSVSKKKKSRDTGTTAAVTPAPTRKPVQLQPGPAMYQPASVPAAIALPSGPSEPPPPPAKVVKLEGGPSLAKKTMKLGPGPGPKTSDDPCAKDPNGALCHASQTDKLIEDSLKALQACTGSPGAADSAECKAAEAAAKAKDIANAKGECAKASDKFACQVDLMSKMIGACFRNGKNNNSPGCAEAMAAADAAGAGDAAQQAAYDARLKAVTKKMEQACSGAASSGPPATWSAECKAAMKAANDEGVYSNTSGGAGAGGGARPCGNAGNGPSNGGNGWSNTMGGAGAGPCGNAGRNAGPRNTPATRVNNRNTPIARGPRQMFNGARNVTIVPVVVLPDIFVGGNAFAPDGFVPMAQPVCGGVTAEGCALRWQNVATDDGGVAAQCVQYCPRAGGTPVAAEPPPAGPAARACEVAIFADGNLGGMGSTTTEDQPQLGELGWEKQIASIDVKDGTWDFFTDANYTGETMRLAPGSYRNLGDRWSKQASSFMCVQPPQSNPAAAAAGPTARTCEVAVFADANLAGMTSSTTENQARLDDIGWAREITSIQVRDGSWDFYPEPNFAGESLHLAPGTYGILGERWAKKIASFKCTQPPR